MAGRGADHSIYKPDYSSLADMVQIVYLDHRGNGRSEDGPRDAWTLAQWGDEVRAFCDASGIVNPIVPGASFGGMVALACATRHPASLKTHSDQHRGSRRRAARATRKTVRAVRRAGSRRAGAESFF
jgi:pimeloyl-ACP methyl ester carboxylesterase